MLLQIEIRRLEPDITLLELTGKISLGRESQRIETLVQDLLRQEQKKIILDISRVDHLDSTGIGILAYCYGTVEAKAMENCGSPALVGKCCTCCKSRALMVFSRSLTR